MRIKRYDRGHIVELSVLRNAGGARCSHADELAPYMLGDGKATYVVLHANLLEGSM
jgi:hypothetical protein